MPPMGHNEWLQELAKYEIYLNDKSNGLTEILIGDDIAEKLMTGNFQLPSFGLSSIQIILGWTVMGRSCMSEIFDNSTLLC